ncbi:hypothetical protein Cfor_05061, partial [Coptotermes formosanus]
MSEDLITELPVTQVYRGQALLNRGQQCCQCVAPYQVRQAVRVLPCGHQFHAACVSRWLQHASNSCPLDGAPVGPVLRHRSLQLGCGLNRMETGKYRKQTEIFPEPPLLHQALETSLQVKGLSLLDRRDFHKKQQLQQPDKSATPFMVSSRHYSAKLGFSGQFHRILLALTALVLSRDTFNEIKQ